MFRSNLFAMSALGVCLAMAPVMVSAPSAQSADDRDALFVPLVDACVSTPTVETCEQVRTVLAECANELDREGCSVLFEDADEVFENPAQLASSQAILSETAEAIAAMEFPDALNGEIDDDTRADAERTLLRGDENLMSHSAPPLLEGEGPPVDAKDVQGDAPRPVTR